MKIIFYCQNLLGIGHLTRSLAICRALSKTFEVDFVQGGPDVGKDLNLPNCTTHFLSPLLMEESDSSLYDPHRNREVSEIFCEREDQLKKIALQKFDHCIIELYPFGRRKFRNEVSSFLQFLRKTNPQIKVHCSLRDILVESEEKKSKAAVDTILKEFDSVLVHSDPHLFRLEETFPLIKAIENKIIYTGYVTEGNKTYPQTNRKKEIMISLGGGSVGIELLESCLPLAPLFPDYIFRFIPGPFSPQDKIAHLKSLSSAPNILWTPFLKDFEKELSQCSASISLAGYNTVMNLLSTRTPALVYPYRANHEQEMRSQRLMKKGYLTVLQEKDLEVSQLFRLLQEILARPYPITSLQLNGAIETGRILKEFPQ